MARLLATLAIAFALAVLVGAADLGAPDAGGLVESIASNEIAVDDDATTSGLVVVVRGKTGGLANCSLAFVDYTTGDVTYLYKSIEICVNTTEFPAIPFGVLDGDTLYFINSGGKDVFTVDITSGMVTAFATVERTANEHVVGMVIASGQLVVVTTHTIYHSAMGSSTGSFSAGGNFPGNLSPYSIATTDGNNIYTVTPSENMFITDATFTSTKLPIGNFSGTAIDIEWYNGPLNGSSADGFVLLLSNYVLYGIDPTVKPLAPITITGIPDGDGFPGTSGIYDTTFFFGDFDNVYSLEVPTLDFATKVPFDSYFVRGGFHYVDAMPTAVLRRGETYRAGDFL